MELNEGEREESEGEHEQGEKVESELDEALLLVTRQLMRRGHKENQGQPWEFGERWQLDELEGRRRRGRTVRKISVAS